MGGPWVPNRVDPRVTGFKPEAAPAELSTRGGTIGSTGRRSDGRVEGRGATGGEDSSTDWTGNSSIRWSSASSSSSCCLVGTVPVRDVRLVVVDMRLPHPGLHALVLNAVAAHPCPPRRQRNNNHG